MILILVTSWGVDWLEWALALPGNLKSDEEEAGGCQLREQDRDRDGEPT